MNGKLRRADMPPQKGKELWIRRLKDSEWCVFTIISPSMWGCYTHYNGERSEPCYEQRKSCPGCRRKLGSRWKGYLHAYDHNRREEVFIELTPAATWTLFDLVGENGTLRGCVVKLTRGGGDRTRLKVDFQRRLPAIAELPEPKSPFATLVKLWDLPSNAKLNGGETVLQMRDAI